MTGRSHPSCITLASDYAQGGPSSEEKQINDDEKKLGDKLGDRLGDTKIKIIKAILTNPKISISELSKLLNISSTVVEKNLKYLKTTGYISREGKPKSGHWEVHLKPE